MSFIQTQKIRKKLLRLEDPLMKPKKERKEKSEIPKLDLDRLKDNSENP